MSPPRLRLHREMVDPIAVAWLQTATGFGVWQGEDVVEYWPQTAPPGRPDLRSSLGGLGDTLAIGVVGPDLPLVQLRLDADAAIITRLLQSELELDLLAADLVDRQDQVLALYELSRAVRGPLDLAASAATLARETRRLMKADGAFIVLTVADEPARMAADPVDAFTAETARDWLARVNTPGREVVVEASAAPPGGAASHLLVVPIYCRQRVSGVLGLARHCHAIQSPDVKLARAIAEQTGALIENALVHREQLAEAGLRAEMQLAARVQSDLLPRTWPATPGLEVFASMRPGSLVGGDFYDVMRIGPTVFVCLGDVSGKGASAALVMAMTRAVLRGAIASSALALDHALRSAAEGLYTDLTALEMFATAFLATYDVRTREVCYINAGHWPVVLRRATGEMTILTSDEPPLGMLPTATSTPHRLTLEPDDVIVVASDGISESTDVDGAWFGFERFAAAIDGAASGAARAIGDAVFGAAEAFRSAAAHDDQTILVLKGRATES